jgi:hypothetical protein
VALSLDELERRTGRPRQELEAVLADEVRRGRVLRGADGRFALVPSSFPPATHAALRALSRPDVASLANGDGRRRARAGQRLGPAEWWNLSQPFY